MPFGARPPVFGPSGPQCCEQKGHVGALGEYEAGPYCPHFAPNGRSQVAGSTYLLSYGGVWVVWSAPAAESGTDNIQSGDTTALERIEAPPDWWRGMYMCRTEAAQVPIRRWLVPCVCIMERSKNSAHRIPKTQTLKPCFGKFSLVAELE